MTLAEASLKGVRMTKRGGTEPSVRFHLLRARQLLVAEQPFLVDRQAHTISNYWLHRVKR
jgi:hypothetical protein